MAVSRTFFVSCCVLLILCIAINEKLESERRLHVDSQIKRKEKSSIWQSVWELTADFPDKIMYILRKNNSYCNPAEKFSDLLSGPKEAPKSLHNYIKWHQEGRKCLESISCEKKPKAIIWRCHVPNHPCAGLGDRLRGIASTFYLSYASQRMFFIDWPPSDHDHYPLLSALIPASVDWTVPKSLISVKSSIPAVFWGTLHEGPEDFLLPNGNNFKPGSENFEKETAEIPVFYISTVATELLIGKLQKNSNTTDRIKDTRALSTTVLVRAIYKTLFRPSKIVTRLANKIYPVNGAPYISIHSRTGEDVGEANSKAFVNMSSHKVVSASLLKCAVKVDPIENSNVAFLASDSITFKQEFIKKAKKFGYRVISPNWRALHLRKKDHVMGQISEKEHCQEFLNIFVDLILMSRGRALISTGSGFARVAFYFGTSIGHFIGYDQQVNDYCKLQKYFVLQ